MKLALFDIDGTLIRGARSHHKAFVNALWLVHDIHINYQKVNWRAFSGLTDKILLGILLKQNGVPITKYRLRECFTVMETAFQRLIDDDPIELLPGVKDLLSILQHAGVIIGHLTGNLRAIAQAKMIRVGIEDYFMVGGYGDDEHDERFELIKVACQRAESKWVFKRNQDNIFLFGDTPRDVKAGKLGGVKTIAVATGSHTAEEILAESQPDLLVPNLEKDRVAILKFMSLL